MSTYELGPKSGRVLLKTSRSGLGKRAGHDLTIEATRWSGTATGSSVRVTIEVDRLEIREGTGGVLPLTDSDRKEIKKNLRKVLRPDRYPEITFVSSAVEDLTVRGELTIMGRTEELTVRAEREGDRIRGGTTVRQSRWGIKPYSAFFGALKLADDVEVTFDLVIDADQA